MFRINPHVPALIALGTFASITFASQNTVTLTSKNEVPYTAKLTLKNVQTQEGHPPVFSYAIHLSSKSCQSTITGNARFYSKADAAGDDSAFLQNGDTVKTSVFKGTSQNANVTIAIDVESKLPRYAGVSIDHADLVQGGCISNKNTGWNFFAW